MAVAEASPVGRRFLDLRLVDVTRPPPGPLCWLAAIGFSGGLLIAAVLSAHASGFLVAALLAAMSGLFLLRPLAATVLVIVIHQSVDLWANGQLESIGGLQFNLTTGLTLLVVLVGGAYVAERWDTARRAPSVLAFLVFAAIATVSLVHAPALTQGIPEVLRIVRIGVVYTLVFVLVRSRRDIEMILMAQFASIVPVIAVAIYQTFTGSDYHASGLGQFQFDRATGGFDGPDELGIILGVMLCAAIPLLFGGRVRWWPALLVWMAVAMTALVGSYTRTGWISLIAGLLVIGVVRYRSLLVIVPVTLAIVVVAVPSTVQRFNDLTNGGESSAEYGNTLGDRLSLWHENLPKVNRSPVIGERARFDQRRDRSASAQRLRSSCRRDGAARLLCVRRSAVVRSDRRGSRIGPSAERSAIRSADIRVRCRRGHLGCVHADLGGLEPDDETRCCRRDLGVRRACPRRRRPGARPCCLAGEDAARDRRRGRRRMTR